MAHAQHAMDTTFRRVHSREHAAETSQTDNSCPDVLADGDLVDVNRMRGWRNIRGHIDFHFDFHFAFPRNPQDSGLDTSPDVFRSDSTGPGERPEPLRNTRQRYGGFLPSRRNGGDRVRHRHCERATRHIVRPCESRGPAIPERYILRFHAIGLEHGGSIRFFSCRLVFPLTCESAPGRSIRPVFQALFRRSGFPGGGWN